jgi:RimJ/RimL family protein N-acetyltransferase
LLLQPYVLGDETGFVALFQDARVSQWMGEGPATEESDRALFRRIFSRVYSEDLFDVWAVHRDGRLIGHAEIKPTDAVPGHEIIYALELASWGFGLGTELASAIVSYGFDTLKLTEVFATVAIENTASLAVLDKIGFTHVRDINEDGGSATRVLSCSLSSYRKL